MNETAKRNVSDPEWEQRGAVPDWRELPEQKRSELLMTLAGMLVQAGESKDEHQP